MSFLKRVAEKKVIWVAAAALYNPQKAILLAQRSADRPYAGLWELPGGKIELNELPEAALIRELYEELGIKVEPEDITPLTFVSHQYPEFHLVMMVWSCRRWQGEVQAQDGQAALAWVAMHELDAYPLLEADKPLVPLLKRVEFCY
jgi:8-oxo-dGTP diphosphatase